MLTNVKQSQIKQTKCWKVLNNTLKKPVAFKIVEKFPMNKTNFSEINLDDQNQDEYDYLRNTLAFAIEFCF